MLEDEARWLGDVDVEMTGQRRLWKQETMDGAMSGVTRQERKGRTKALRGRNVEAGTFKVRATEHETPALQKRENRDIHLHYKMLFALDAWRR